MENRREQQGAIVGPLTVSSASSVPASAAAVPSPARPGRLLWLRRFLRLLLRRLLYGVVIVGRALRPYAAFLVIILAQLGLIGWLAFRLWAPQGEAPPDTRAANLPPAPAIENYIKGRQSFDADMMWEAFSTSYQTDQLERGASKATLQAQANNERLMGLEYVQYAYIGGVKLEDGGSMYFYAVDLELQNQRAKLPIIFTADAEGKIERIMSPLNN